MGKVFSSPHQEGRTQSGQLYNKPDKSHALNTSVQLPVWVSTPAAPRQSRGVSSGVSSRKPLHLQFYTAAWPEKEREKKA